MSIFAGIMTFLLVVAALMFGLGILLLGSSFIVAAAGCVGILEPENHFVIGVDYGLRVNDLLERMVVSTEKTVELTEKSVNYTIGEDEEDSEEILD